MTARASLVKGEGACGVYRRELAEAHQTAGRLLRASGDLAAAAERYARCREALER